MKPGYEVLRRRHQNQKYARADSGLRCPRTAEVTPPGQGGPTNHLRQALDSRCEHLRKAKTQPSWASFIAAVADSYGERARARALHMIMWFQCSSE
jgi:hypothetical protein